MEMSAKASVSAPVSPKKKASSPKLCVRRPSVASPRKRKQKESKPQPYCAYYEPTYKNGMYSYIDLDDIVHDEEINMEELGEYFSKIPAFDASKGRPSLGSGVELDMQMYEERKRRKAERAAAKAKAARVSKAETATMASTFIPTRVQPQFVPTRVQPLFVPMNVQSFVPTRIQPLVPETSICPIPNMEGLGMYFVPPPTPTVVDQAPPEYQEGEVVCLGMLDVGQEVEVETTMD